MEPPFFRSSLDRTIRWRSAPSCRRLCFGVARKPLVSPAASFGDVRHLSSLELSLVFPTPLLHVLVGCCDCRILASRWDSLCWVLRLRVLWNWRHLPPCRYQITYCCLQNTNGCGPSNNSSPPMVLATSAMVWIQLQSHRGVMSVGDRACPMMVVGDPTGIGLASHGWVTG